MLEPTRSPTKLLTDPPTDGPTLSPTVDSPVVPEWTLATSGLLGDGGWTITTDGTTARFDMETPTECGGANGQVQSGTANSTFTLLDGFFVTVEIDGRIYNGQGTMEVAFDGQLIVTALDADGNRDCRLAPPVTADVVVQPLFLEAGEHFVSITVSTANTGRRLQEEDEEEEEQRSLQGGLRNTYLVATLAFESTLQPTSSPNRRPSPATPTSKGIRDRYRYRPKPWKGAKGMSAKGKGKGGNTAYKRKRTGPTRTKGKGKGKGMKPSKSSKGMWTMQRDRMHSFAKGNGKGKVYTAKMNVFKKKMVWRKKVRISMQKHV